MAGVFQVMAFAVSAMDKRDADPHLMSKLAKIATSEMITSKVWNGFEFLSTGMNCFFLSCQHACLWLFWSSTILSW